MIDNRNNDGAFPNARRFSILYADDCGNVGGCSGNGGRWGASCFLRSGGGGGAPSCFLKCIKTNTLMTILIEFDRVHEPACVDGWVTGGYRIG